MTSPPRLSILILGVVGMLVGLLAAADRLMWPQASQVALGALHGPLMVTVALTTLIGMQRATTTDVRWRLLAPLSSGLGGLLLLVDSDHLGPMVLAFGAAILSVVCATDLRTKFTAYHAITLLGTLLGFAANTAWWAGAPIPQVVWAWTAYLTLVIVGVRRELSRKRSTPVIARRMLNLLVVFCAIGALGSLLPWPGAVRLMGLAFTGIGLWLVIYDVARQSLTRTRLPRFAGAANLMGYAWLAFAGIMIAFAGPQYAGLMYDAQLHAIFLGFVTSVVIGHAPIIIPAILRIQVRFQQALWAPLALLHLTLMARISADITAAPSLAQAASWGTLAALSLFLIVTATGVRAGYRRTERFLHTRRHS